MCTLLFIYLLFYLAFNSQGHIVMGSLLVEEKSAYCIVNHQALASNYQLSNMKRLARDSNRRPQRLEVRTLTATPPSCLHVFFEYIANVSLSSVCRAQLHTIMISTFWARRVGGEHWQ